MADKFTTLVEDSRQMIDEALERINEVMEEASASVQETGGVWEPDTVFADAVIGWLSDDNVIQIPNELHADEHFREHRFKAKFGRSTVNCWGSALLRQPAQEGFYDLHLFVSDWNSVKEPMEFRPEDYARLGSHLRNFYERAASGELLGVMNPSHPAFGAVSRINALKMQGKLATVRFWIITNRFFTGNEKNGRHSVDGIEMSAQIVDLGYLGKMFHGEAEINQSFEDINGLPAIHIPAGEQQDYDCYLTAIRGRTLAELYSKHGPAIVRANVRAYLGDVVVNKGIKDTVQNEPARFLAYNNGLVVSADEAVYEGGRLRTVNGIQIINGGQTTASIYQTWLKAKNNRKDPGAIERLEANLDRIRVPMKIVVSRADADENARSEFRVRISEAANSQNAVKVSDLAANHPFQIDFASVVNSMQTPDGKFWFYESARGLYNAELDRIKGSRALVTKFKEQHPKERLFNKTAFALAYMSTEGLARECARGAEVAFKIFNERIDVLWDYQGGYKMTKEEAQQLVARQIMFNELEKAVRKNKTMGVKNPRVPVLYTLMALHDHYGGRIRWDVIWANQGLTDVFRLKLLELCQRVDAIVRANMGNFMINMYGRQPECADAVRQQVSFDGLNLEQAIEIR